MSKRYRVRALNFATAAATIAAVVALALRTRQREEPAVPVAEPRLVHEWSRFSAGGVRIGPAKPRVTIVEFSDFKCRYCREAASIIRRVQQDNPTEVAIVFRHFPLQDASIVAAVSAECARRASAFESMHDRLFAHADSLGLIPWVRIAREAGVQDTDRFTKCLSDSSAQSVVMQDVAAGDSLFVRGTPTFMVNDQLFEGTPSAVGLAALVRDMLRARR